MSLEYRYGHFSIIYRPNGRYAPPKRIPIPKNIQDRADAQIWHDTFLSDWKAGKSQEINPKPMTGLTVARLWNEYLPWFKMHRAETTYRDLVNVSKYVKTYIGTFPAEDLGAAHINIYKKLRAETAERLAKEKAMDKAEAEAVARSATPEEIQTARKLAGEKTLHPIHRAINKEVDYIRGFVRWASRAGHITPRQILVDKLPYERPIPQILSVEEIIRILDACDPFYEAFFLCLYTLGLRVSEAKRLKRGDFDMENMSVRMKQKGGTFKILPIGERLKNAVQKIVPAQICADDMDKNLFTSRRRGQRYIDLAIVDVRDAIARACLKAEVKKRVHPHLFRHSISCHLMGENVNVSLIQNLLGHKDIKTTQWYSHVSMANLKGVETVIAGFLAGKGHRETK